MARRGDLSFFCACILSRMKGFGKKNYMRTNQPFNIFYTLYLIGDFLSVITYFRFNDVC